MPSSPLWIRPGLRLALLVALLAAPAGCETARPDADAVPRDADVLPRAAEPSSPAAPPGKHATRRGPYVFYHDFEIDPADPLLAELEALPDQVYGELHLPPGNEIIQVFLFDTQDRYERYMKARYRQMSLPNRRAYFIEEFRAAAPPELKVFTWMGDHLRTDLRHELTHALLHNVLKAVPIWLDEGLAGYFELPPEQAGVNPQHLESLRRGPFMPDLARLEKLGEVKDMEKPEYREAWAWVHIMLRGAPEGRRVLHDYLQALRTNPNPGPLLPRLEAVYPNPDQVLADHLARIELPRVRRR
jgi:hypothetical protein